MEEIMGKFILFQLLLGLLIVSGCAKNTELVQACGNSLRGDVFCEVSTVGSVPQGYADLLVVSSLKTHKPGYHHPDEKFHGTSDFKLLINIDGQAGFIVGSLGKENIEPRRLRDPEAGDGIRYQFRKNLRMKAGTHKIVVVIPDDEIVEERELTLTGGSVNILVLEPVYGTKRSGGRMTTMIDKDFYEGIEGFRMILNGKTL